MDDLKPLTGPTITLNADQITWFNNVVAMLPERDKTIAALRGENARLTAALQNTREFVADELAVRIDSHTLGGDMATLDETDGGIVGEAVDCLARIDAALKEG